MKNQLNRVVPILVMSLGIAVLLLMFSWSMDIFGSESTNKNAATNNANNVACTEEAKICPDGSAVGRIGPNCEFAPCPNTNGNVNAVVNSNVNSVVTANSKRPVLIYTSTISTTKSNDRNIPTYQLWKKINNGSAEKIISVGDGVGYPSSFLLSPDQRWLAYSLETKIGLVDLQNKTNKIILTKTNSATSLAWSADSQAIIAWVQAASPANTYQVRKYTISTATAETLFNGTADRSYALVGWRDDGYLILNHAWYPAGWPATLNLQTGIIHAVSTDVTMSGQPSPSAKLFYEVASSINDLCNDYSGSAFSLFNVRDSLTGVKKMTIGDNKSAVNIIAFKPDDTAVLFTKTPIIETAYDQCSANQRVTTYYRQSIDSSQPVVVADPVALLADWNANNILVSYTDVNNKTKVLINGQDWNIVDANIVAQYYTE